MDSEPCVDKKHNCELCNSSFTRPYRLWLHVKSAHENVKNFTCTETGCTKSYTSKSHLDRHINSVHVAVQDDIIYSCPFCLKIYSNRQNLKRHIKLHHAENKTTFSCSKCNVEFKKKHQLSTHMYIHTGIKCFSCDLCSKEFVTLADKKKHQRRHKTYKCEDCDEIFTVWSKMMQHKNEQHRSDMFCAECGRKFLHRAHLIRHIKLHTNPQRFPCTYENCIKVYSKKSNLKQHVHAKHKKQVYECEICGVAISLQASMKRHMARHQDLQKPENHTEQRKQKDKGT